MENYAKEILDKIKEQNIQPKKRWEFLFKDYLLWLIFIVAIILGGLASSVTIFVFKHVAWLDMAPGFSPLERLWINLPLFWLLSLSLFSLVAWYDFKNTKRGYKYRPIVIVLFSVILSGLLGYIIYFVGFGQKLEETFFRQVPFYKQMFRHGGRMLVEPDKGHLAGVVTVISPDFITVEDFGGRCWSISTSTDSFQVGQRVMLIGHMADDDNFICESIKPWLKNPGPPPMFFRP